MTDSIRIVGLGEDEVEELDTIFGDGGASDVDGGFRYGAPDSITYTVILSQAAIQLLSIWIMQHKSRRRASVKITRESADGSRELISVQLDNVESSTPESIAQELAKKLDLPTPA